MPTEETEEDVFKNLDCLDKKQIDLFFDGYRRIVYCFVSDSIRSFRIHLNANSFPQAILYEEDNVYNISRGYVKEHIGFNVNNSRNFVCKIDFYKKVGIFFFLIGRYLPMRMPLLDSSKMPPLHLFKMNFIYFRFLTFFLLNNYDFSKEVVKDEKTKEVVKDEKYLKDKTKKSLIGIFEDEKVNSKLLNLFISSHNTGNNSCLVFESLFLILQERV